MSAIKIQWHKKFLGLKCAHYLGIAQLVDGNLVKKVMVSGETLEDVSNFCYLGDMLSANGGCELASIS